MSPNINDSVRLEMVRLSSALIRNAAGVVTDSRKDIIKFGWQFIRDDDILIKYASYVLVTQFIVAFQTPVKIVSQAYTSLLKAHHVENRVLVRQALDILMPVLPERLSNLPQDQSDLPSWARWAKRVLFEQSVSVAHTTHIYQLIAAHPTMFYPYRMQFATSLVGILQKMCLTHSATTETRTLALDIMDLFLKWHAMQEKESKPSSSSSSVSPAAAVVVDTASAPDAQDGAETAVQRSNGTANGTPPAPDLLMTEARRETIVGLLLRMLCLVFDFALKSTLGPRALELLSSYLDTSKWPPMHLRLTFFERSISQIEQQGMNHQLVLHILTVLSTVTKHMQPGWFEEYYSSLVTIVRKCISVENTQVQRIIATLLRQLYEQAADNERLGSSNIVADLRALVESLIMENLQSNTNLFGTLMILHATGKYIGEQFYSYIPTLMKFVQKYTKEHNNHSGTAAAATVQTGPSGLSVQTSASSVTGVGSATSTASPSKLATTESEIVATLLADKSLTLTVEGLVRGEKSLDTLLMLVLLLKDYISRLGDQRRSFLTYIIQLIERSSDPCLLHVVLAVVREWVLDPQEVFPTIKEKAMLMSSMMSFVHGSVSANDNTSRTNARAAVAAAAAAASSNYLAKPAAGAALDANGNVDMFSLLERKYLSLVLEVYNDPRFTRSEMTMRLEQAFLSGMQSEDSEMRHRFLDTFDANMPPSLPVRLNYLLETQNWESVSSTFWLQQCLPLLFASTHQQASLRPFVMRRIAGDKTSIAADHDQASKRMDVDTDSHMDVDMDGDATADAVRTTHTNGSGEVEDMDMDTADNVASHSPVANGTSRHDAPSAATTNSPFSVGSIVRPLTRMVLLDTQFACNVWVKLFPLVWHNLSSKDQHDLTSGIIRLLAKPYHQAQTASRPNVIQAILDACCMCTPMPRLPPQLLRYLGQTYGAWYSSLAILEHKILDRTEIESAIFDRAMGVELGAFDALTELYTTLSASHYFYGAWKRHGQYRESHIALAYEQLDDWANAQASYEQAQTRARAGVLPFSESEYCLWESRWVETTRRLQSWDMLLDLGAHESLPEIELDAGWRQWSWPERQPQIRQLIKATPAEFVGSARAKFYETYLSLIKNGGERAKTTDFQRMCKDGIRLCLQQWNELPPVGTPAHINILHMFQLMVELGDASSIYLSLATTKAENLEVKSTDLKSVLQTWRERLPNNSDPINIWSDLVTWRQHIFKAINDVYVPFIPQQGGAANEEPETPKAGNKKGGNKADAKGNRKNDAAKEDTPKSATPANSTLTSFAYRGYHEMAWIINRFAHVARLHGLIDVCISSLTRIYTLPNIEIQEAFLKLREQAKCYYDREEELQSGLDVISNTNLMYFQQYQKAEFFTLKGQFLTKLGKLEDANHAFAMGIQVDLASAKAWGAWGRHNDYRFNMNLSDTTQAVNAISCYMQAAGLSKRPRVRRYLARTLWLLGQDDEAGNVCTAFDNYKSEMPTWYWIAFIPQLLVGLDTKYSRQSLQILLRIAK
ncbi:transcription-associated protein 1, partial [Linderina macrospora]